MKINIQINRKLKHETLSSVLLIATTATGLVNKKGTQSLAFNLVLGPGDPSAT